MQVLLFARLRDAIGADVVTVEVGQRPTLAAIRGALQQAFPQQAELFAAGRALTAVNQQLINDDQRVLDASDEVAFFPPMTGG